jgi:hypothetical protein
VDLVTTAGTALASTVDMVLDMVKVDTAKATDSKENLAVVDLEKDSVEDLATGMVVVDMATKGSRRIIVSLLFHSGCD